MKKEALCDESLLLLVRPYAAVCTISTDEQMCGYGQQEGRGDESASFGVGKRYALDQPTTDGPPWPFGYWLNGLVTRP